jgi:uncharacterized membrane protein YqiK
VTPAARSPRREWFLRCPPTGRAFGTVNHVTCAKAGVIRPEDVLRAARTLGEKTLDETSARDLLGSSIEEALIAVAADSKFDDLRSSPGEVCDKVQSGLREAAAQVGMDIASIKLTDLSPVPLRQLDPNDRIDARAILAVEDLAKRAGLAKQELLALIDGARGSAGAGGFKA